MKQEGINYFILDIYNKVLRDNNITDKKIMDILYTEAIFFNDLAFGYFDKVGNQGL